MQHSDAVADQIRARIAELKHEVQAHERALAVLETPKPRAAASAPAAPKRSRRPRAAQPTRASSTPRRAAATADSVLSAIEKGTDEAAVIAKQFGVSTAVVRNRLQQLEQAGRVTRTGNKRSTRWHRHAA